MVRKRKTELGGTFSVASWILFIGLFSTFLYQIITNRSIEVHKVSPVNAPDLLSFVNDMEFNITTISSMSCSHLRGLGTLVVGTPGFIDHRVFPLSTYGNYYCQNTSNGPTVSLKCSSCQIPRRNSFISWQFVDLPNDPAVAVGFQFKVSVKVHDNSEHVSFVSGTLQSESYTNNKPRTFRGPDLNILKIHLFPQIYKYLHDLRLMQPLFYDFVPGSSFSDVTDLQSSLQRPRDGLINTTLDISYLSDYVVEIDKQNMMGPVSILANAGGLYAMSLAFFLYFLLQCEARIKKLRNEDKVMRDVRSRLRAQKNWHKLRKYVVYTWGPNNMGMKDTNGKQHSSLMIDSCCIGSMHKMKPSRNDSTQLLVNAPNDANTSRKASNSGKAKSNAEDGT